MNITSKQWFQIITSVIGGLTTGAALLQTLFGQALTIQIVAVLGIANIIMGSVGAALSGQASLVRDVAAMPGVGKGPMRRTSTPAATKPASSADSKRYPESRVSLPMTTRLLLWPPA